ncbi:MAG: thiamine pyrophosphate-dependent enzyme [Gammaproteobacteria bacterium]|nr:thiamine pyrophosphate-dependent enzyme [Gammaproteobacteria bacterium]MDH3857881.1 thiamine pyrophosphate-dependent enzyme [Gammaproteobacteria bacterium]
MRRDHALEILKRHVSNEIVVAVYQTLFDWMVINPRDLNYVATGAMGQASSHGLGLALSCPGRRVLVFDGDGSLLMNLGSLVTIANAAPVNFHHFVFINKVYEVNGAHPIPGADKIDFAAMARAAGYRHTLSFSELDQFEHGLGDFLAQPGPALAAMQIEAGKSYPRDYAYIHSAEARARFRNALASS